MSHTDQPARTTTVSPNGDGQQLLQPVEKAPYALRAGAPVRFGPARAIQSGSLALAACGGAAIYRPEWLTEAGVAAATTATALGMATFINQRRRGIADESVYALERVAGPVANFKTRLWAGWFVGAPRRIRFDYHPGGVLTDMGWPGTGARAIGKVMGVRYRVTRHNERLGRIWLTIDTRDTTATVAAHERPNAMAKQIFGADATITPTTSDNGELCALRVEHTKGVTVANPGWRETCERVVTTMLPGRWRARWDLERDVVVFELRPTIPKIVDKPIPIRDPAHPDYYKLPLGVDEDGNDVCWDLMSSEPHFMCIGKTGKGKTNVLRGVAIEAANRGFPVRMGDPKRVEFLGLRGFPNIEIITTQILAIMVMINDTWNLMEDRYVQMEEGHTGDFPLEILIIDEFSEFATRVTAWWKQTKVTGMPAECPIFELVSSLVRLGRVAGIRVGIGLQRPDARFFGQSAESRDNFDARLSLGSLTRDASGMLWGNTQGCSIPAIPGRAMAAGHAGAGREVQTHWIPDARKNTDPASLAHLDRLTPAETLYHPKTVELGELEFDDKGRPLVWSQIENGSLIDQADLPDNDTDTDDNLDTGDIEADDDTMGAIIPFPERPDPYAGYGDPRDRHPADLGDGDLIHLDDTDTWVLVEAVEPDMFNDADTNIAWRTIDDSDAGTLILSADALISTRRLVDDDESPEKPVRPASLTGRRRKAKGPRS